MSDNSASAAATDVPEEVVVSEEMVAPGEAVVQEEVVAEVAPCSTENVQPLFKQALINAIVIKAKDDKKKKLDPAQTEKDVKQVLATLNCKAFLDELITSPITARSNLGRDVGKEVVYRGKYAVAEEKQGNEPEGVNQEVEAGQEALVVEEGKEGEGENVTEVVKAEEEEIKQGGKRLRGGDSKMFNDWGRKYENATSLRDLRAPFQVTNHPCNKGAVPEILFGTFVTAVVAKIKADQTRGIPDNIIMKQLEDTMTNIDCELKTILQMKRSSLLGDTVRAGLSSFSNRNQYKAELPPAEPKKSFFSRKWMGGRRSVRQRSLRHRHRSVRYQRGRRAAANTQRRGGKRVTRRRR